MDDDESRAPTIKRRDILKGGVAVALTGAGCSTPSVTDAGADVNVDLPRRDGGSDGGGSDGGGSDGGGLDAGTDAGAMDATSPMDAATDDAGFDADLDSGADAPIEPIDDPPEATPLSSLFDFGVASGDVTLSGVILWTRYDGTAPLRVVVWEMAGDVYARTAYVGSAVAIEGYVHHDASGLSPSQRYRYCFFELAGTERAARSSIGRFEMPPPDDALVPVTFGAVSCISNTRAIPTLGHAGGRSDLSFFAFLGDSTYNDGARTIAQYRAAWESNIGRPEFRSLRGSTGAFVTWDDHEFDNDVDPETFPAATMAAAKQTFFEHQPLRRDPTSPDRVYKRVRWGRTLELFVLDCRAERMPSTRGTAGAQYISPAQMAWLKAGLSASTAVFKVILNSVPVTDCPGLFDLAPADRWEGYAAQRTEILAHIDDAALTGVLWVAGDFHLCSAGRVSPSGVGATQIEVLVGPAAQSPNPLAFKLRAPQFDVASGTNNYAVIRLDPVTTRASIDWVNGAGTVFQTRSYDLG